MIKQVRAVAAAHFGVNAGLVPLAMISSGWVLAMKLDMPYIAVSAAYVAMVSLLVGIGLRLHLSSYRGYLTPGLRGANSIVALGVTLTSVLAVGLASPPGGFNMLLAAELWLCAAACLYVGAVSKNPFFFVLLLVVPFAKVRFFALAIADLGRTGFGLIFVVDLLLTIVLWKRMNAMRARSLRELGGSDWRGLTDFFGTPPHEIIATPNSLAGQIRYFLYLTPARAKSLLVIALLSPLLVSLNSGENPAQSYGFLAAMPLIVGFPLTVSPRLFMLPLHKKTLLKQWGAALFVSVLLYWAALTLPVCASLLAKHTGTALTAAALSMTTLTLQLPLFGIVATALSFKTSAGARLNIPVAGCLFAVIEVAGPFMRNHEAQTILGSILLGPILIWLAYRRWCTMDV